MAIEDRNGCLHGEKDGKFVSKGDNSKAYNSQDNLGELKKRISKNSSMTSQEWALWYKAVGKSKKLGYWAEELPNGDALLRVETDKSSKLVITGGTFEKPSAKSIFEFDNSDDLIDFIDVLKEKR